MKVCWGQREQVAESVGNHPAYPATVVTVVAALTLAIVLGFLGACNAEILQGLAGKAASVGRHDLWKAIMAWRFLVCGGAALVAGGVAAGAWVARSRYEPVCDTAGARVLRYLSPTDGGTTQRLGRSVWAVIFLLCVARVPTIPWAHFVRDDFEILTANRTNSLAENIVLQHGDHAYPLYRIEVWLCDLVFGTWAPGWNAALLATYAISMWLAAKSARALGAAPVPTALALALLGFSWTMGVLHAGYYVLSTTVQIAAAAFAAFLAYEYADRTRRVGGILAGMTALLAGCLIDISGIWILGAVPLLLLASRNDDWSMGGILRWMAAHRHWIVTWVASACVVAAVHGAIYCSSRSSFLSMSDYFDTPLTLPGAVKQVFYLLSSGTVLQLFCPLAAYLAWPVHLVSLLVAAAMIAVALRFSTPRERVSLMALVLIMLVFAIEVAIGRPQKSRVFFPQYIATLNMLAVPVLGMVLTVVGRCAQLRPGGGLCGASFVISLLCMMAVALGSWLPSYGAYIVGLRANQTIRRDIGLLSADLSTLLATSGGDVPAFPALDGRHFKAAMPRWPTRAGLAPYNLSHYRHFMNPSLRLVPLVRNDDMDAWVAHDVTTVGSLRQACGPAAVARVKELPALDAVLRAAIDLKPFAINSSPSIVSKAGEPRLVSSDGFACVAIHSDPFDPEEYPHVLLDFDLPVGQTDCNLVLTARLPDGSHVECGVPVSQRTPMPCGIRLLEVPCLAMQPRLEDLSLRFACPGSFAVRQLSLVRRNGLDAIVDH
jgi:hypothetical protein